MNDNTTISITSLTLYFMMFIYYIYYKSALVLRIILNKYEQR